MTSAPQTSYTPISSVLGVDNRTKLAKSMAEIRTTAPMAQRESWNEAEHRLYSAGAANLFESRLP
jgi:hypothetical protein